MGELSGFGIPFARVFRAHETPVSHVLKERALHRVLRFTGHTIDDVVNNPIVKNKIFGYYKLHRLVDRRCEIVDLERQWNSVA
ncbi:MAG TPA: hypothetical protein VN541_10990 [Tepidisphaeraceae bacterium]|nr:hypothetical protein [Tepidisphaeraceae bacterium]